MEGRRVGQEGIGEDLSRRLKGDLDIRQFTTMMEDAIQKHAGKCTDSKKNRNQNQ